MIVRLLATGLLALLMVASSACSFATRFGYNHLDWFAKRELNKYIDLTDRQSDWLEPRFETLWDWHRATQLPLYAQDLNALAQAAEQPLTAEQLDAAFRNIEAHVERVYTRATPEAVTLLAMLSDDQVEALLRKIDKDNDAFADEVADHDAEHRREDKADSARDWLDKRLGRLTDEQRDTVEAWSHTREDRSEEWVAYSRAWRDGFAEVLASRRETGFAEDAAALLFDAEQRVPADLAAASDRNRQRWLDMVAEVSRQSTPRQRAHLVDYIADFAEDFRVLAERAQ